MIGTSLRASVVRVGCRRTVCPAVLSVGRRQPPLLTGENRASDSFNSGRAQGRAQSSSSRDIGMGTQQSHIFAAKHSGFDSNNHHSVHRAAEQDANTPPTTPRTTATTTTPAVVSKAQMMADQWRAARSKVSAEYLKRFMKKYGRVAVIFHLSVFFSTLGTCYSLVDYGGLDIADLVKNVPILADNLPPASAGNLAIAYGMTSAIGPPRAVLTITLTPRIAKFWAGREEKRRSEVEERR